MQKSHRQSIGDNGVEVHTDSAVARAIREDAFYPGVRVAMDSRIATAVVRFRLDVNFGDPPLIAHDDDPR